MTEKIYLETLKSVLGRSVFHYYAYSGIFIKLHILRHICPHWDSDIFKIVALPVQVM